MAQNHCEIGPNLLALSCLIVGINAMATGSHLLETLGVISVSVGLLHVLRISETY